MTENLTFKRATSGRAVSPDLLVPLRRILNRDPSMAVPPRDHYHGSSLGVQEQQDLIVELMKSVDENAHRRGRAEAAGYEYDRTEVWAQPGQAELALLDIQQGEVAIISYELLAQLMRAAGYQPVGDEEHDGGAGS